MVAGLSTYHGIDMRQYLQAQMPILVSQFKESPSKVRLKRDFLREQKVSLFRINKNPFVEKCYINIDRLVIVHTKDIRVDGVSLGQYEILVDFFHGYKVKMLNITRRLFTAEHVYDGPCIKNTIPCFGNLELDIYDQLSKKKLYAIVEDCIDFLRSSDQGKPYITLRQFDSGASYLDKGYNFKKYLKNYSYDVSYSQQYSSIQQQYEYARLNIPDNSSRTEHRTFFTPFLSIVYKINNFFRLLARKIANI